jgi:oxidase EvaA
MDKLRASFLSSMLSSENIFQPFESFDDWLSEIKSTSDFKVRRIDFSQMKQWGVNAEGNLVHNSGRFFSIVGVDVELAARHQVSWDQPIISQPEIGLLGILSKDFNGTRYFLMQAKIEPGNVGLVQLSPTVQATHSNMEKVHGGHGQDYLEYFIEGSKSNIISDQIQSEQGSRFYQKRNRNIVIDIVDDVPIRKGFRWLSLRELKLLLERDNIINMDARSVISCFPFFTLDAVDGKYPAINRFWAESYPGVALDDFSYQILESMQASSATHASSKEIALWLGWLEDKYSIKTKLKPLQSLTDWEITESEIRHKTEPFFSIIAVTVQADSREVSAWDQPLIKDESLGMMGFIAKKIEGLMHLLVQARIEAGSRTGVELSPTVSCTNYRYKWDRWGEEYPLIKYFMNPDPANVVYDSIQSEEGGRFYKFQNRNVIISLDDIDEDDIPENYKWMSLYQIEELQSRGLCTCDTRTLLSSLFLRSI